MAHPQECCDVCIIGAGISGLSAARKLQAEGKSVILLEKSRGVAGRAATRRWQGAVVDHGTQYFTVRSHAFNQFVEAMLEQGTCFRWSKGFHFFDGTELIAPASSSGHPRYACENGMSSIGKFLAADMDIRREAKVVSISKEEKSWLVTPLNGAAVRAQTLVMSPPAPQCLDLLKGCHQELDLNFMAGLASVRYAPSLCVVGVYKQEPPEWKGIQLADDRILSWIANDTSKRHQPPIGYSSIIVFHGSAPFSEKWLAQDLDEAADRMLAQAGKLIGQWLEKPCERFIHRWRYALVTNGYNEAYFLKSSKQPYMYAIGDAFYGAKVEGAFLSGLEAANDILFEGCHE